ncbi:MAG: family 20 glycosylhydrolase [Clostridia bacterium]|nr:family 20 glycosylhydrolase [Clostridia bacterium]
MFTQQQISLITQRVRSVTGIDLPWRVAVSSRKNGLRVVFDRASAAIEADGVNSLARGFFLLSRAVKENRETGDIFQRRHFSSCGVMVDASRNAVPRPETVKRLIDQLACLGMNMLMLYTEDTYEVPGYPAMGYLRGGYTQAELREIDDYAAGLGVELVPCIQTLAHLSQFLQWDAAAELRDTADVLLIDSPETYAFIEAQIAAASGCVRSRRIHIGMDEAFGVGLGRFYERFGPQDRFEMLSRHLKRVSDICQARGLRPIMWSDMFFRLGSKTNAYYDRDAVIPQSVIDSMPPVSLCYWDYYHTDPEIYDDMLTRHERLGGETVFAGGIWTWSGFLPQVKRTEASMSVGLRACAAHGVDTVFATMWGDDGAETNISLGASLLPIFSEACWQGADYPAREATLAGECLTGIPRKVLDAWGDFYPDARDTRPGKQLIWGDLMYPLIRPAEGDSFESIIARSRSAIETMRPWRETPECRYASLLFEICAEKADIAAQLRDRYLNGDSIWLTRLVEERIPALLVVYEQLQNAHRLLLERDNRRFGWEVLCLRYGAVMNRLRDTQYELRRYLGGEIPCVEELEAEPKPFKRHDHVFTRLVTPSVIY